MPSTVDHSALAPDLESSGLDLEDPIVDALSVGVERDLEDLRDISAAVRYVHSSTRDSVSMPRFHLIKFLAMLDLFTEYPERRKKALIAPYVAKCGVHPSKSKLCHLRSMTTYRTVVKKLLAARDKIQRPQTPHEMVQGNQQEAFARLSREVVRGKGGKVGVIAAKEFTDRAYPKTAKDVGDNRALRIMEAAIAQQLVEGMEVLTRKLGDGGRVREITSPSPGSRKGTLLPESTEPSD